MMRRYHLQIRACPITDYNDVMNQWHLFNDKIDSKHIQIRQAHPEYSHTSYLRMRHQEEAYQIMNYMDQSKNRKLSAFMKKSNSQMSAGFFLSPDDRSICMQRLIMLQEKKRYKVETLMIAAAIFDRYLMLMGHWAVDRESLVHLCVICMILAGKLNQSMQPCYDRMVN